MPVDSKPPPSTTTTPHYKKLKGSGTTNPLSISTTTKDSFILESWSKYQVKTGSPVAPTNGFAFEPGAIPAPGATLAVYMNDFSALTAPSVAPQRVPFWISPLPYGPGSENKLLPLEVIRVFFTQKQLTVGSMVSDGTGYETVIEFGNKARKASRLEWNPKTKKMEWIVLE
ncbi:hypothetical protein H0H93_011875 [Arthromyces matolae]|nr:hypothetical protein H0H93_011875 [Arthromyces matolae]